MASEHPADEIIVIDNKSKDEHVLLIKERFPNVKIRPLDYNYGFAKPMNIGIRESTAEFILMLNNDAFIEPDFIGELVKVMERDEKIGSVTGKVYRVATTRRGKKILDTTGHILYKNRLCEDRGAEKPDRGKYDKEEEIFGPCAAAAMYRRTMLEDIKIVDEYLDESFFAGREDIDLNWRAQLRGWRSWYVPQAIAHHKRSATINRDQPRMTMHNYKNWRLVTSKNESEIEKKRWEPVYRFADWLKKRHAGKTAVTTAQSELTRLAEITQLKHDHIQKNRLVDDEAFSRWYKAGGSLILLRQIRRMVWRKVRERLNPDNDLELSLFSTATESAQGD